MASHPPHVGFVEKLRVALACGVAIVLLRTVGWLVAEPIDSLMPVTFTGQGVSVLSAWPALLVLTSVAAMVGTAIAGPRLPEAGVFAAGIGLASLALRSRGMQMLLAYRGAVDAEARRSLMITLAGDCLLWATVLAGAWLAAAVARRWLWSGNGPDAGGSPADGTGTPSGPLTKPASQMAKAGWPALIVTTVVGACVIWLTISRTPVATIARGQVIASVAGGLFLGAMVARYFTSIDRAYWYGLAAPAVGLIGYLLGYINAGMGWAAEEGYPYFAKLATTPPHDLVRPLPIEYVSVGVAAAIAGFWTGHRLQEAVVEEDE